MDKFIVFDLDGTIADTLEGIYKACNEYLEVYSYPFRYSKEEIRSFIGNGIIVLFQKMTKKNEYSKEELDNFIRIYGDNQKNVKLFDSVKETMDKLVQKGYRLFVFSNKQSDLVDSLNKTLFKDLPLTLSLGHDIKYKAKPDPTMLNTKIINNYNLDPNNGYYVGDSIVDYQTAINANLTPILCNYGYGNINNIDCIKIDKFSDLLNML